MSLSDRIRPNCEAAAWVCEEVKQLERENAALRQALEYIATAYDDGELYHVLAGKFLNASLVARKALGRKEAQP